MRKNRNNAKPESQKLPLRYIYSYEKSCIDLCEFWITRRLQERTLA
jgi:hypothetical protein